jgi:hypothetical protein
MPAVRTSSVAAASVAAAIALLSMAAATSSNAQVTNDLFDQSQGGFISSASPTISGFDPIGMIGGATTGEGNSGNTIFQDTPGLHFIQFGTAANITFNSVSLYVMEDNANGSRGTSVFSLLADADNNGTFETTLVGSVNPVDNGLANTFFFTSVTARSFRAEFTSNPNVQFLGPRVIELDAANVTLAAPEPSALALLTSLALPLAGMVIRKRRKG